MFTTLSPAAVVTSYKVFWDTCVITASPLRLYMMTSSILESEHLDCWLQNKLVSWKTLQSVTLAFIRALNQLLNFKLSNGFRRKLTNHWFFLKGTFGVFLLAWVFSNSRACIVCPQNYFFWLTSLLASYLTWSDLWGRHTTDWDKLQWTEVYVVEEI